MSVKDNLLLLEAVERRIKEAKDKDILNKIIAITEKFGDHTRPSYQDCGETFYEDVWSFKDKIIDLYCHKGYFGHYHVTVSYNKKEVFSASKYRDSDTISSFIPGAWEKIINEKHKIIADENKVENEKEEQKMRDRFGITDA